MNLQPELTQVSVWKLFEKLLAVTGEKRHLLFASTGIFYTPTQNPQESSVFVINSVKKRQKSQFYDIFRPTADVKFIPFPQGEDMKKTIEKTVSVLKGVSTLDIMIKNPGIILLLLISMMALGGAVRGGHSTLDVVDPSFNPNIQTNTLTRKTVDQIIPLPNGKILVAGTFNRYNLQPVGALVRLNADQTLDTTFNSNLPNEYVKQIVVQADGKILVLTKEADNPWRAQMTRLNADGSVDTTFSSNPVNDIYQFAIDANGRIILTGAFPYMGIIRLNSDGSQDATFQSVSCTIPTQECAVATQNNKVIIGTYQGVQRLNENGTIDTSFIQRNFHARSMIVQPDGKILLLGDNQLIRLNENGSNDPGFRVTNFTYTPYVQRWAALSNDGRITFATRTGNAEDFQIRRLLNNGIEDSSFTSYIAGRFNTLAVQANGSALIGDGDASSDYSFRNDFVRLFPNGSFDPTFNTGAGFLRLLAGVVRTINAQPDGKILIGGRFDFVNNVIQPNIARFNPDSTLDTSFHINTSETGNYFSQIVQFNNIRTQSDGKIVAVGDFDYVLGGATKSNLVRLNSDGSIDPTFILGVPMYEWNELVKLVTYNDGKLLVGTSKFDLDDPSAPIKLTATGELDTTFNSSAYPQQITVYILDVAVQPDGKILIGGQHVTRNLETGNIKKSFLTRLNADGSLDTTFQPREELGKIVRAFALLPNGKIVIAEAPQTFLSWDPLESSVLRLNADGTVDPTFNAGTGADGKVNTMLLLETGRIFVGGKFTNFNGQPRRNLVQLNADGSVFTPVYNVNDEVLSLAVDSTGRVFVGGNFTTIIAGNSSANRSYVAALIDAPHSSTRFDFDGDGRADISVFRPSDSVWYLNRSTAGFTALQFGLSTDKITPGDFDGDGKTDIAVFRDGAWWLMKSSTNSVETVSFGVAGDIPVPANYTGDGRDELAVYRSGQWWTYDLSSGNTSLTNFGLSADKPVPADYNGDGRVEQAVYRNGEWHINLSSQNYSVINFGLPTDQPVVGDYDGDHKADMAVYRDGMWYLLRSSLGFTAFGWGLSSDIPAPADYDGDGKTDAAVFRDGFWYLNQTTNGVSIQQFGLANDTPVPSAYLPR